jgi:hypothetical protein
MMWVRTTIRLEAEGEVQKREQELGLSRIEARSLLLLCHVTNSTTRR